MKNFLSIFFVHLAMVSFSNASQKPILVTEDGTAYLPEKTSQADATAMAQWFHKTYHKSSQSNQATVIKSNGATISTTKKPSKEK